MATVANTPRVTTVTPASTSSGPFLVGFRLFEADAVAVYVAGLKLDPSAYTVTATFADGYDDGATVMLDAPVYAATEIRIEGDMKPARGSDYLPTDPSVMQKMNVEFGRIWATLIELRREADRSLRTTVSIPVSILDPGRVPIWTGDGFENGPNAEDIADAQANADRAEAAADIVLSASNFSVSSMVSLLADILPFPVGSIITVRKEGFAFEVVTVGDDPDLVTAGTVYLRALPDADGFVHLEQYGAVPDGNRLTGAGTDNTAAIRRAFTTDHNIKLGRGFYRVTEPIFNLKEFRHVKGQGMGGVNGVPADRADFKPNSCLLATGTPTKRVITRRKYRASASDPNDAPMAAVLENWGGGSEFYDFSIECFCDYTDTSPTNYGADWDIGFYNGCRGEVSTTRMSVMGYFNRASFYWDVTDDFTIPQLLDPEGNPIPKTNDGSDDEWTVRASGADWCRMSYCSCIGGSIGVAILGAGSDRTGAPYYDFITDQTYSDGRGKSGASDFRVENCQIRSVQHHSAHRRFDPAGMTYAAMNATPDEETGAALYIDGWQSSGDAPSGGIRGFTMAGGRVESWEPFRVRLGQVNDILFTDRVWNEVGAWALHAPLYATDGITVVDPVDYDNFTYGHFCTNEYSGLVYWEYSTGSSMFNDWVYDWEYTIVRDKQGRVRSVDQGFITAPAGANIDIPLSRFRPGGHISISVGGVGNSIPLPPASGFYYFDVAGSPNISAVGSVRANVQIIAPDTVPSDANVTSGNLGITAMGDGRLILRNRLAAGETIIAWRAL